jgi:X-linked retinitis pigmentosa GTPase regulator
MALFSTLTATLAGKAAAGVAGLALAGGGIAVAVDHAQTPEQADNGLTVADEAQRGDEPGGDAEAEERLLEVAGDLAVDEIDTEDNGEDNGEDIGGENGDDGEGNGDEESNGRSGDVHDALTGDDTSPGDPEFGEKVSQRAQEGGREFGQEVADAARGENGQNGGAEARENRAEADENRAEAGENRAEARDDRAEDREGNGDAGRANAEAGKANADGARGGQGGQGGPRG